MQNQKVKEKTKKTNLEKYGFENVGQSPEIKEKVRETNLKRFGVEYPAQSLKVREKMKEAAYKNKLLSKKNTTSQLLFRSKETLEEALLSLGERLGRLPYLDEIVEASGYADPSTLYKNLNLTDYLNTHYQVRLGFSKAEREISNFLSQYYEIIPNSRSLLSNTPMSGKEIDIYIPSLKIGIEFNGLYWHATKGPGLKALKPQTYHRDKYEAAQQNGIFLIQIFEDEYIIDPEACLENLLYTLIATEENIYPLILEDLDVAVIDLCKTNPLDNQYLAAGWQMVEEIIENYFFVNPKTFQRFSEEEIPKENIPQYYKIYGAGLQIWQR